MLFLFFINKKIKNQFSVLNKNQIKLENKFNKLFFRIMLAIKGKKNYKYLIFYKNFSIKNNKLIFDKFNNVIKFNRTISKDKNFYSFNKVKFHKLLILNNYNTINFFKNYDVKFSKLNNKNYFFRFRFKDTLFFLKRFNYLFFIKFFFINDSSIVINPKKLSNTNTKITSTCFLFFEDKIIFIVLFIDYFFFSMKKKLKNFLKISKTSFNLSYFLNYLLLINDKNIINLFKTDCNFISNNFLKNYFNFFDYNYLMINNNSSNNSCSSYNNYYPIIFSNKISYKKYFSNFKNNYKIDFIPFTNKFVISFLEKNFKKNIFIKFVNNFYNVFNNYYLDFIINDYKRFQPAYWKTFLVKDFIKILWYSFFLKDLTMISKWISIFMESLHFKNHKKFLSFFFNFLNKNSGIFIDVLKVKGFFFDIRGKVGVTGSSKKRHFFVRFGSINKSSKKTKINFSQNLVRTYSGVLGLTYILNY